MTWVHRGVAALLPTLLVVVLGGAAAPAGASDLGRTDDPTPTCAGEPATVVGRPGQDRPLRGTSHHDVIVTNDADSVDALGGDDLICITGGDSFVDAGRGDDNVFNTVTDELAYTWTDLGAGVDRYHGSAGPEIVSAQDDPDGADEPDVVELGAGDDSLVSGVEGAAPVADIVDLGDGDDFATVASSGLAPTARLVGGPGVDSLSPGWFLDSTRARWMVANSPTSGTAAADGEVRFTWDGFEDFRLGGLRGPLTFTGGDGTDRISGGRLVTAELGGGDDEVQFDDAPGRVRVAGGNGFDRVEIWCDGSLDLDLGAGTSECHDRVAGPRSAERRLTGFEAAEVSGYHLDVRGSARADDIQVLGCRGVVRGLTGRDRIRAVFEFGRSAFCWPPYEPLVLLGGPGDDVVQGSPRADNLRGGPGDDVLRGAPGRDLAVGGPGDDRCRAESARTCEVVHLEGPVQR